MKTFLTKLRETLLFNLIWEVLNIWLLIPLSALILSGFTGNFTLPCVLVVLIALIIICYKLYIRWKEIGFEHIILHKYVYLEYLDGKYLYNYDIIGKSLINNLTRYYSRMTCSQSKTTINCLKPTNAYIQYLNKDDEYVKYDVMLNRTYNIGDVFKVEVNTEVDEELKFSNLGSTVIRPTKTLELEVKLPKHLLKTDVIRRMILPSPAEVGKVITTEKRLNEDGSYKWTINNPKIRYEYRIEWDFDDLKNAVLLEQP